MSGMACILDFETLDTIPSAVVTSLSVLVFDPSIILPFDEMVGKCIKFKFDYTEQIKLGRTTSESTIEFWKKPENAEAFKTEVAPSPNDISILSLQEGLYKYLNDNGYDVSKNSNDKIYCRGNTFDFGILDNIYDQFGWDKIVKYYNHRDVRTEIDAISNHLDDAHENNGYVRDFHVDGSTKHNSAHDIARDVLMMQFVHYKLLEKLGGE